ncbi:uncharacterized protein LOC142335545 [Convolutriloba macropyga]|uniref:uncharacterized protein LOC142335545 n=1 Tax=Convolutriloba macropyga TaxID=536237 RepID=UPI003F520FCB
MSDLLSTASNSSQVHVEEDNMDYFKEMSTRVFTILAMCSFLGNSVVIFSNHWILDETTRYRMTTSVICGCDLIVKLSYLWGIYILTHSTKEALESTNPQVQACVIQAFIIDFFYICSMVYMACLMIMMTCKYLEYIKREKTLHRVLHVIPWVIATIVTLSTACNGVYGYDRHLNSGSCWLVTRRRISKRFSIFSYGLLECQLVQTEKRCVSC